MVTFRKKGLWLVVGFVNAYGLKEARLRDRNKAATVYPQTARGFMRMLAKSPANHMRHQGSKRRACLTLSHLPPVILSL
jgi:hypothetical protein